MWSSIVLIYRTTWERGALFNNTNKHTPTYIGREDVVGWGRGRGEGGRTQPNNKEANTNIKTGYK